MKSILFIMPDLPSGGAEKLLVDIFKRFDFKGYKLSLLLEYNQGVYLDEIPSQIEVLSVHGPNNIWFERLHRVLRMIKCYSLFHSVVYKAMLKSLLDGRRFDTIVSFMEGSAVKYHSYLFDKADRNVSWVHIDFIRKHWSLDFFSGCNEELRAYERMDKIVFVSDAARDSFLKIYPSCAEKSIVQYNLIDKDAIVSLADTKVVTKNKFTICMVGRLNEQKRYERSLEVARRLKEVGDDYELWILGEGGLEPELKRLASNYCLEGNVKFLGFVKPAYAYMKQADLFLNTSDAEGYPLTICEALCLGLPIVATDITGTSEILDHSKYGVLTNENEADIFDAVHMMINDSEKLNHYREMAKERSKMFQPELIMNHIYSILS